VISLTGHRSGHKSGVEPSDGRVRVLELEARVDVARESRRRVPEEPLSERERNASACERARVADSQRVEVDDALGRAALVHAAPPRSLPDLLESDARVDSRRREVAVEPLRRGDAGEDEVLGLGFALHGPERLDRARRERDRCRSLLVLRDSLRDRDRGAVEVEVRPAQETELAAPKPGRGREAVDARALGRSRGEELLELLLGEGPALPGRPHVAGLLHGLDRVGVPAPLRDEPGEKGMERRAVEPARPRREVSGLRDAPERLGDLLSRHVLDPLDALEEVAQARARRVHVIRGASAPLELGAVGLDEGRDRGRACRVVGLLPELPVLEIPEEFSVSLVRLLRGDHLERDAAARALLVVVGDPDALLAATLESHVSPPCGARGRRPAEQVPPR
jgi:hypothetical protein